MGQLPFFPIEASTIAGRTDLLFLILILLSTFFTSIIVGLIIYWGIKYRRGKIVDRSNPPSSNTKVEVSWMLGLLVLAAGTYGFATKIYLDISRPPANSMDIYVVGQQWMWKFQHTEGIRENNTLHVPVNKPVRIILTSQDVIHSFYVPAFRLKHDAVPGRYYSMWFQANQVGEFPIRCAEYCGTNHSKMLGTVIVMEQADYQAWLAAGGADTSGGTAGSGQQLFTTLGCSGCHAPGQGKVGPSLVGLYGSTVQLQDGSTVTADENYIRESILFPQNKVVAGFNPVMPTFQGRVSEQQLQELITFIKSLKGSTAPASGGNSTAPAPTGAAGTPPAPGGAASTPTP